MTNAKHIIIKGAVQGVGFRPFIYNLALGLGLKGFVGNISDGVEIEVEGEKCNDFLGAIKSEFPKNAIIDEINISEIAPQNFSEFEIKKSSASDGVTSILPDIAVCDECLEELNNPLNRRYKYPFISCTNCGPRYSVTNAIPYDRANTNFANFKMCESCESEYKNPSNRRFHAQNISCEDCGIKLELWDMKGNIIKGDAISHAVDALKQGKIIAIKGLGGFHLMCSLKAESELRRRKKRGNKSFAIMFPDLLSIEKICEVSDVEKSLLNSKQAPIVLLKNKSDNSLTGAMLPYNPLQYLIMHEVGQPIIATSGNLSGEPICFDGLDAVENLKDIADLLLAHNLPISNPIDDSLVRVINNRKVILRRARGYAPSPVKISRNLQDAISQGSFLKNTVSVALGNQIFTSEHIGDLQSLKSQELQQKAIQKMTDWYKVSATEIKNDEYQHHYCHALSCMIDNDFWGDCLAIVWDGNGLGDDKTSWGGEFLQIKKSGYERFAHFKIFSLIGGDKAAKEPRRIALSMLYEIYGDDVFDMEISQKFPEEEFLLMQKMLKNQINCIKSSSVGRIFDGIASLLNLTQINTFEGEAAMELEYAADKSVHFYKYTIENNIIDWTEIITGILSDLNQKISTSEISAKFHNTLAQIILEIAKISKQKYILLSGGCFQNKLLTELAVANLESAGFNVLTHENIPPNDGGISVGQLMASARNKESKKQCV